MLASIDFLRRSKAIIDFHRGEAVFEAVSNKVVKLEESSSGHLLVDLTKDLVATPSASSEATGTGIALLK